MHIAHLDLCESQAVKSGVEAFLKIMQEQRKREKIDS